MEISNKPNYLIWLGVSAATGVILGLLAERKHPARGSALGAAAGIAAGSLAAGLYDHFKSRKDIPFYSTSSPQYDETYST